MGSDAEALQRGYRALRDPLREPAAFDHHFVHVDEGVCADLATLLTFEDAPTSVLLCGAPGVGKSTQLRALARALRASHRLLHIDVDQELDLQQVETVDLLFLILAHAWARTVADGAVPAALLGAGTDLLAKLRKQASLEGDTGRTSGAALAAALTTFGHGLRSAQRRDRLRSALENAKVAIPLQVGALSDHCRARDGRPLVVVLDGLDTMEGAGAQQLLANARDLTDLPVSLVVTAPASLIHSPSYRQVARSITHSRTVGPVPLTGTKATAVAEEVRDIVHKRLPEELVDDAVIDSTLRQCGGRIGALLDTLARAVIVARRTSATTVTMTEVDEVLEERRADERRLLRPEELTLLGAVTKGQSKGATTTLDTSDPAFLQLLDHALVFEAADGAAGGYTVPAFLQPLLQEKKVL